MTLLSKAHLWTALALAFVVSGLAIALLPLGRPAPSSTDAAESLDAAALGAPEITLDYTLYGMIQGQEVLLETTRLAEAVASNASGKDGYRLRDAPLYVPRTFTPEGLAAPKTVAEFVVRHLDPALLVPGKPFRVSVPDALAPDTDLVKGEIPRRTGPYPLHYEIADEEFRATAGHEPTVGEEVRTTSVFSAFVDHVHDGQVRMRVNVEEGGAIVARPLAAVFSVEFSEDRASFFLVLNPVRDTQFRLPVENKVLGLPAGNYLWMDVSEASASYVAHATFSPLYVGADFVIEGVVVEAISEVKP